MQMKTFRAESIPAVAQAIRDELGVEAVLMGTRTLSDGTVEATAALERRPEARPLPSAGLRAERFEEVRKQLQASGLSSDCITRTMESVDREAPGGAGVAVIRREVRTEIAAHIATTHGFEGRTGRIVAMLVGPTGVGKTTTIAKIAACASLQEGKRVGLVTLDSFRIGAVGQLRSYAEILDAPFFACADPGELRRALDALRDCDLVLIDTAGRNPFAPGEVAGLTPFVEVAPEVEVHLTLSASTRTSDLFRLHERHEGLRPVAFIFTKMDESNEFGGLVTLALRTRTPVSFLGVGQRVPEDLEPARPARLAAALLSPDLFVPVRSAVAA